MGRTLRDSQRYRSILENGKKKKKKKKEKKKERKESLLPTLAVKLVRSRLEAWGQGELYVRSMWLDL
jgi:hypothetical protein